MKKTVFTAALLFSGASLTFAQNKPVTPTAKPKTDTAHKSTVAKPKPKKHVQKVTQQQEVLELDHSSGTVVVEVKNGGLYIDNELVSTIKNAKTEDHKIVVRLSDDDNEDKKVKERTTTQVHRGSIGVYLETNSDNKGATVLSTVPFGPAWDAGIRAGDVITKVNSTPIHNQDDLITAIGDHNGGEKITITYNRGTSEKEVSVVLEDKMPAIRFERYEYSVPDLHGSRRMPPPMYNSPNVNNAENSFQFAPELGINAKNDRQLRGVKVMDVKQNTPAEDAGFLPGDVILRVDNFRVTNIDDLQEILDDVWVNQVVHFKISRNGESKNIRVHFNREKGMKEF